MNSLHRWKCLEFGASCVLALRNGVLWRRKISGGRKEDLYTSWSSHDFSCESR